MKLRNISCPFVKKIVEKFVEKIVENSVKVFSKMLIKVSVEIIDEKLVINCSLDEACKLFLSFCREVCLEDC